MNGGYQSQNLAGPVFHGDNPGKFQTNNDRRGR